jgi:hypothetical protein
VHLFGYAIYSFERPQISMRFAIRISKGITLSLLLSYSVVKEPTSAKGRQSCQTPTSVSSGLVPFPVNPTRLMRTPLLSLIAAWKRSAGPYCFAACRDRGFYVPAAALSTTASLVVNSVPRLTIPHRSISDNPSSVIAIPVACCTTCCAGSSYACLPKIRYRSGTSQNDPMPGPIPPFSARHDDR